MLDAARTRGIVVDHLSSIASGVQRNLPEGVYTAAFAHPIHHITIPRTHAVAVGRGHRTSEYARVQKEGTAVLLPPQLEQALAHGARTLLVFGHADQIAALGALLRTLNTRLHVRTLPRTCR